MEWFSSRRLENLFNPLETHSYHIDYLKITVSGHVDLCLVHKVVPFGVLGSSLVSLKVDAYKLNELSGKKI